MTQHTFSLILILLLVSGFTSLKAQQSETKSNEQLIMQELTGLLQQSELISGLQNPVVVRFNMPDRNRLVLFNQLLEMGKSVKMEGDGDRLQILVYADNSLEQLDREDALRKLDGEMQLFVSNRQDELQQTETLRFSYSDTIHISLKDEVQSEWSASRFHTTDTLAERNIWRDYGQPAIIVAATGITVFLLFNLRS